MSDFTELAKVFDPRVRRGAWGGWREDGPSPKARGIVTQERRTRRMGTKKIQ